MRPSKSSFTAWFFGITCVRYCRSASSLAWRLSFAEQKKRIEETADQLAIFRSALENPCLPRKVAAPSRRLESAIFWAEGPGFFQSPIAEGT
ncbi:hypothetical protein VTN96DRAFT_9664 [Rasamsonia emersonii]